MRFLADEGCDFGRASFFLPYPFEARHRIAEELVELVRRIGEGLAGCFVTVQPGRSRIGRIPGG